MSTLASPQPAEHAANLIASLAPFAQLPDWLVVVVQTEKVRRALEESIPEFVSGMLLLEGCEIGRVRIKKGRWAGTYQLTTRRPHDGQRQVVQLLGALLPADQPEPAYSADTAPLGDATWRWYVPALRLALATQPPESALPALGLLTDSVAARGLLEHAIAAAGSKYDTIQIQACVPTVVRYKPGSRCTILYQLHYAADRAAQAAWPATVIAKTYKGDKGQNAHVGMRALWASPLSRGDVVMIAEPLAFLPDLNVLVQGSIAHESTLKDLIRSALREGTPAAMSELTDMMRKTARGLAALHRSGAHYGEATSWEDELAEGQEVTAQLSAAAPTLAGAAAPLLARLEALAKACPADPLAPTHGSFRPGQVLISQNTIGFIDFDGFGQAEPALDLALFLSSTKNIGLSEPHEEESNDDDDALDPAERSALLAGLDVVCEAFLAEYEQWAPVSRQRVVLWETLALLSLVLTCWTKIKPVRLSNTIFMLERHVYSNGL
jgi:hypothetical protein